MGAATSPGWAVSPYELSIRSAVRGWDAHKKIRIFSGLPPDPAGSPDRIDYGSARSWPGWPGLGPALIQCTQSYLGTADQDSCFHSGLGSGKEFERGGDLLPSPPCLKLLTRLTLLWSRTSLLLILLKSHPFNLRCNFLYMYRGVSVSSYRHHSCTIVIFVWFGNDKIFATKYRKSASEACNDALKRYCNMPSSLRSTIRFDSDGWKY